MTKNPPADDENNKGNNKGDVKGRPQFPNPQNKNWGKHNAKNGQFMNTKPNNKNFKGLRRER